MLTFAFYFPSGNWNYAAGIGNDPRQGRHFNVIKQGGWMAEKKVGNESSCTNWHSLSAKREKCSFF